MKKVISVFASLVLAAWLLPAAFGQMSQQPQPQDPTTQQPSTSPQSTPPTQPQSEPVSYTHLTLPTILRV